MSAASDRLRKILVERRAEVAELEADLRAIEYDGAEPSPPVVTLADFVTEGLLESDDDQWLVRQLVPRGGMGFLAADPELGKTTLLVQLSLLLAAGRPFFGYHTVPSRALLIAAEGARRSLAARVHRAARTLGVPTATPTWFIQGPSIESFFLRDGPFAEMLAEAKPHFVILDPLKQFWKGDENSADSFTENVTRPLKAFGATYGCTFCLIHHHRKAQVGEEGGPHQGRGTGVMFADADFWWRLTRDKEAGDVEGARVLHCDKSKYSAKFPPIKLTFDGPNAVLVER